MNINLKAGNNMENKIMQIAKAFRKSFRDLRTEVNRYERQLDAIGVGAPEPTPQFEDGELVIVRGYLSIICKYADGVKYVANGGYYSCDSDEGKPLTIGETFKTKCSEKIFSNGRETGEFVIVEQRPCNSGEFFIESRGGNKGKVMKTTVDWTRCHVSIVMPAVGTGYYDKQIGKTGMWVRAYVNSMGLRYQFSDGMWCLAGLDSTLQRIVDTLNLVTIPLSVSKGVFVSPEGGYK